MKHVFADSATEESVRAAMDEALKIVTANLERRKREAGMKVGYPGQRIKWTMDDYLPYFKDNTAPKVIASKMNTSLNAVYQMRSKARKAGLL